MSKVSYTIADVKQAVAGSKSIAGVLRQLGLRPVGGNYRTVKRLIVENGINIAHFTGQGWNVGLAFNPKRVLTDEDIFVENSAYR